MFTLTPEYFRPGLPYVFAQEVQVDAADQVLDQSDRHLDMVEMVIMVQGTPTQEGKPTEQGARIVFNCVDYADPRGKEQVFAVMWVVAMGDMLSIARLPDKHIMRVVAQPCISDQKNHQVARHFLRCHGKGRCRCLAGTKDLAERNCCCNTKNENGYKTQEILQSPSHRTFSHDSL